MNSLTATKPHRVFVFMLVKYLNPLSQTFEPDPMCGATLMSFVPLGTTIAIRADFNESCQGIAGVKRAA